MASAETAIVLSGSDDESAQPSRPHKRQRRRHVIDLSSGGGRAAAAAGPKTASAGMALACRALEAAAEVTGGADAALWLQLGLDDACRALTRLRE